jgi:DNA-binding response OmpR family regulator
LDLQLHDLITEAPLIVNVDDHDAARFLRTRVLTQEGYRVVEAATAADAREHGAADGTELTLLDISLPDGSGFDVCRALKEDRPFIPVVIISSTHRTTQARLDGLAAGADAYLMEPVPPKQLVGVVRGFLGHVSDADRQDSGWVITDPGGLIEAASQGMERVLNLTVRNLTGRRLPDYFEDRDVAGTLLRGAVAGHGSLRTLKVRPRERAALSSIVQTSPVAVPGDSLHHVRWAFTVEGRWRRATAPAPERD